jgi:hypothetical protein
MKIIKRIGDVNPITYGGGVVVETENGIFIEHVEGIDEDIEIEEPQIEVKVYRVEVVHPYEHFTGWAMNWGEIARFIGSDARTLRNHIENGELDDWVHIYLSVASYWGWHELDGYPLTLTVEELEQRWE